MDGIQSTHFFRSSSILLVTVLLVDSFIQVGSYVSQPSSLLRYRNFVFRIAILVSELGCVLYLSVIGIRRFSVPVVYSISLLS